MAQSMNPNRILLAAIKVAALLVAPVLWASFTHGLLSALWPGQVTVSAWRIASTLATVVFGVLVVVMLWRSRLATPGKALLSLVVVGFFVFIAFSMNLRSNCAPSSLYVGEEPRSLEVASCQ